MPFKSAADLDSPDAYRNRFLKEIKKVNGEPGEFFFCQDFPQGKEKADILAFGEVKPEVLQAMKKKGSKLAWGQCSMQGSKLKLEIEKGSVPGSRLKPIFKLAPAYSFEIVDSIAVPDAKSDEDHDKEQQTVRLKRALYTVSETFKDMGHILVDRSTWRKKLEEAATAIAAEDFARADTLIKQTAAELAAQKPALKDQIRQRSADADEELRQIATQIAPLNRKLEDAEKEVNRLRTTLDQMEQAQKGAKRNSKYAEREGKIEQFKRDIQAANTTLQEVRAEVNPKLEKLNEMKDAVPERLRVVMSNIETRLNAVESASKSAEEQHRNLEALVGEMGAAAEFQKEQLAGDGHGTGRHGAQTGLDRQARRAATEDGITPDQPGNKAGTTQHQTSWNKVTITYEEDEEGRRVIKDRSSVQKNIVTAITEKMKSDTGSMWATPVLEREAVTKALKTANALKKYEKYEKDGNWRDFTSLAIVVPKPAKAPGWGYAVKKDGADVDPGVAESALRDFETGAKTLDQLFDDLNVKLVSEDGGAKMIPHATVVFRRPAPGDAWKLVTHYPNDDLSAADVGWECARNWRPGTVTFKAGTKTARVKNTSLA